MARQEGVEFGGFIFQFNPPMLLKGDSRINLQPRALKILSVLIQEAPNVLTRDEIIKKVWGPDAEVGDDNVDTHVKAIRRAIPENCIETIHSTGYRFVAKHQPVSGARIAVLADSDAIVVRSFTAAWGFDEILESHDYKLSHRLYPWGDGILRAIDQGEVDLAIYNNRRAERYINENPHTNVRPITKCFASMQGQNFYVLARRGDRWKQPYGRSEQLRESLIRDGGTVAFRRDTDMLDNLLMVLACTREELEERKVRFIEVTDTDGLSHFSHDQNLLLIHGQNLRFQARYRAMSQSAGFFEIINYDSVGPEAQEELRKRSVNWVLAHNDFVEEFGRQELIDAIHEGYRNFERVWASPAEQARLEQELISIPNRYGSQELGEARYVVRELVRISHGFQFR